MTQIIQNLSEISDNYDALFCDLWGCLHNGVTPYPAAVQALLDFRAKGGKVILVTNSPRPQKGVALQLDAMGVPRDAWDAIASSGDAAQYAMLTGDVGKRVYHIGAPKDEVFFNTFDADMAELAATAGVTRVALDEADGVVCTGLRDDTTETPEDYRAELAAAQARGLKFLCANPDIIVDVGERRQYCAGALALAYEEIGGTSLYYGKPHHPIYTLARRRLGLSDARILCIGDGPATDALGGQNEGLDTLFVTGGLAAAEFGDDVENPQAAALDAWLQDQSLSPRWSIGRLR